ncbi:MAG TPA: hypothetical protein DCR93_24970 [Cytophagales bacterium]|nr:hypothetical protein [Cytophagales bacterium]HAP62610.1 hypothetical protein [Cytophagales bacterium]
MTIQLIASQEQGEHFTDLLHGLGKKNPWSVTRDFFIWDVTKSQFKLYWQNDSSPEQSIFLRQYL